jgi:hypothetical protein
MANKQKGSKKKAGVNINKNTAKPKLEIVK